eukprot:sb/3464887/
MANLYNLQQTGPILIRSTLTLNSKRFKTRTTPKWPLPSFLSETEDNYIYFPGQEVQALTHFKHRNITSLLGIGVEDGTQKYIIMELMDEGSLKTFLATVKRGDGPGQLQLDQSHFTYIAAQVADAMSYMESIKAVHRDIAARNCLVNNKLVVKLADLGAATQLSTASGSSTEYYRVGGKPIPIRWSSPEVLQTCKHSVASDVWSFGVLCWEILTFCELPYGELKSDTEVINAIREGRKLVMPECSNTRFVDLIDNCWEFSPEDRHTFSEVADAMSYMESIKAVHRDIAARNCLVNNKLVVKLADLGAATQLSTASGSSTEYYRVGGKPIPIRWSSPEVLQTCKHSVASDVWSFGVLCWEILTFCELPYGELKSDTEVINAIREGRKLVMPECSNTRFVDLIDNCWEFSPEDRHTFSEIFSELQSILAKFV